MDPGSAPLRELSGVLGGKILVGLDALAEAAKKSGKFDYDAKVAGLEAVDRYTVRFRLTDTDTTCRTSTRRTNRSRWSRAR